MPTRRAEEMLRRGFSGPMLTAAVVFLATAFEKADETILPACFKSIELELGWSPIQLGRLIWARQATQALASPAFGILSDRYSGRRTHIIACGCVAIAAFTYSLSTVTTYGFALLLFGKLAGFTTTFFFAYHDTRLFLLGRAALTHSHCASLTLCLVFPHHLTLPPFFLHDDVHHHRSIFA